MKKIKNFPQEDPESTQLHKDLNRKQNRIRTSYSWEPAYGLQIFNIFRMNLKRIDLLFLRNCFQIYI